MEQGLILHDHIPRPGKTYDDDPILPPELQPCIHWRLMLGRGIPESQQHTRGSSSKPLHKKGNRKLTRQEQSHKESSEESLRIAKGSRDVQSIDKHGVALASNSDLILYRELSTGLSQRSPTLFKAYKASIKDIVRFSHEMCGQLGFCLPFGVIGLTVLLFDLEGWGLYPMWATSSFVTELRRDGPIEPGVEMMFQINKSKANLFTVTRR